MLTNIMYFNSLSRRNSDSAWSKMYNLMPRSLKSQKFGENYQESDFHGRHLEKWPPSLLHKSSRQFSPICFCTLSVSAIL